MTARTVPNVPDGGVSWPDTTAVPPPTDHLYGAAVWLLGRHRQLAELVARLPGVVDAGPDPTGPDTRCPETTGLSRLWVDLDLLAEAVTVFDAHTRAWAEYRRCRYEPRDETAWAVWHDAGPAWPDTPAGAVAQQIAFMSRTERARVRLLACFAPAGARFAACMLTGFDDAGQRLIHDWLEAIRHA